MSPGIQLSGLASGMDTDAVISQLMALENRGRARIELRQLAVQARQDALRDVTTRLNAIKTAATDLRSATLWADTQTAESSDSAKVAVRRTAGAAPGGHQVEVTRIASAEQRTYAFTQQAGTSQITIGSATIDLAAGATIDDAVSAINGHATAGVYAVNVGGKLVLSAKTTGAPSAFTATGAALAEDATKAKPGADAQFTVDGVARTSTTNVVAGAIPGLELTLKMPTTSAVSLTVGTPGVDKEAVKAKVKAFVDAYNSAMDSLRSKVQEKRVANPTSSIDARKGSLHADQGVLSVMSALRTTVGSPQAGMTGYDELSDLGITTGAATATISKDAVAGKLVLDEAKLAAALDADPTAVKRLLGATTGVDGISQALESTITAQTQSGAVIDGRIEATAGEIGALKTSLERFDDRLERREAQLRRQFTALEQALARSQAMQVDLASRLGPSPS